MLKPFLCQDVLGLGSADFGNMFGNDGFAAIACGEQCGAGQASDDAQLISATDAARVERGTVVTSSEQTITAFERAIAEQDTG
ncbi:MAG TPA: hypothetical protein EYP98_05840, partial [Planctomycetes bacterium]|nr:hypothetical protein [Planctomycetota bacterium]